jgi:ankyrin repeat protein
MGLAATVKLLLERGAEADRRDGFGRTPLSHAASGGQEDVVKILLANNVNTDAKDHIGRTPLFYVTEHKSARVLEMMLADDRVKPDSKDYYGMTPLTMAVISGREEIVKLLLATNNVNPDSQDRFGRTPLWWARRNGNHCVEGALLDNAEKRGIVMSNHKLPVASCPAPINRSFASCSVCTLDIPEDIVYYECEVCNDGFFNICSECEAVGADCLDDSHVIIER